MGGYGVDDNGRVQILYEGREGLQVVLMSNREITPETSRKNPEQLDCAQKRCYCSHSCNQNFLESLVPRYACFSLYPLVRTV